MSFKKLKSHLQKRIRFRPRPGLRVEDKVFLQQILILLTLPLFLWVALLSLVYKGVVTLYSKLLRLRGHHFLTPLGGMDMMFVADKFYTRPHSTIIFVFVLEGVPDRTRILDDLQSVYDIREKSGGKGKRCYWKMSAVPQKLGGYWFWKKVKGFKMEDHLTILPQGEIQLSTDKDLSDFVERLFRAPFRNSSPCWHLTLAGNYLDDPNRSVMILRGSHVIFDGFSFAKWHFRLSGMSCLPTDFPSARNPQGEIPTWKVVVNKVSHFSKMLTYGLTEYLYVWNSPPDRNPLLWNGLVESANVQNLSQSEGGKWRCSFTPKIPIELVKMARKSFNTTFYGIVMAGVVGGFRSFIRNRTRESADENNADSNSKDDKMPEWVRSLLPSAKPGHPDNTLVNHWRPMIMKLPMGDVNTAESILEVQHALDKAVSSTSSEFSVAVFNLLNLFPLASFVERITRFDGLTLIGSVTPNSPKLPQLFGVDNSEIFDVVPLFRETLAGITWGCMSSNGTIRICVTADEIHMPKHMVQEVTTLIYEEFINIFEQAQQLAKL